MQPARSLRTTSRPGLATVSAATAILLLAGCGGGSDGADATATTAAATTAVTDDPSITEASSGDGVALFDDSVVHDIDLTFDDDAYQGMIDTFVDSGDKEWISATVTIDGTTFENVGLRLKGNSSLMGLRGGRGGGGVGGEVSADEPASLPWLVRLDKFVDGQAYQGYTSFVVRSNRSATSLNEAVAVELLGLTGQATQEAFATRFSVNGGAEVLRLVIENLDETWDEANFDSDGLLYKAESGGDYSYRGDDPESYTEIFDQETGDEDLSPLIELLDFLNNADDATFAAELPERLDVEAFADYLAFQQLVNNFDDIDGPGNNSYLRYDQEADQFTVVSWDLNLAFGGMGGVGGFDGGTGRGPGNGGGAPEGFEPPQGFVPPAGGPGMGGPGGRSNVLVERFMANEDFAALYEQALVELRAELYGSGAADEILERWTAVIESQASDLVDAATLEQEAASIAQSFAA